MENLYQKYLECGQNIATDTRKITKNCLFIALKGDNFDGNNFVAQAFAAGASYCVIDNPSAAINEQCILVENGLKTLQNLAHYHRKKIDVPVIGITGSNGKTTTKELVQRVLAKKFRVHFTQGNLNNHIGVPLTLLSAPLDAEMLVVEMGANHQGEIRDLCAIAAPTHGLITSIGKAHLEGFGGIEGVKKGKSELFEYLAAHEGTVFININEPVIEALAKERGVKNGILFGNNEKNTHRKVACQGTLLQAEPFIIMRFCNDPAHYLFVIATAKTNLFGQYNFGNLMSAAAIGSHFGVSISSIKEALESYIPDNNRAQIIKEKTNTYILDAYNANPTSMQAGLEQFSTMKADNRIAIIGEMRELGEYSVEEHEKIAVFAKKIAAFSQIILIGESFRAFSHLATAFFATAAEAKKYIKEQSFIHSHLYIKGSRGIQLETIL
ncbi:MAG: hypothetical protein RI894_158 [Bacteroidota bacterium]|jgi:UDP-N-acetylmuramoyl-tripeptide--D-alanyl-D-alanine ligase